MIKLTDIKGAENLPQRITEEVEIGYFDEGVCPGLVSLNEKEKAHNASVSQIEQCGIEFNIETLAEDIYYAENKYMVCDPTCLAWGFLSDMRKQAYINMAKALAASAGGWLRIKKYVQEN